MPTRLQCERHVYRLAMLLTGSSETATRVIGAVRKAQPDLRKLGRARLERVTILRSREHRPGRLDDDRVDARLADFLSALDHQAREAWILLHAFSLDARSAARAMDCSTTALQLHLNRAHEIMAGANLPADAPQQLTSFMARIDLPQHYVEKQRRTRRIRSTLIVLGIVVGVLGLLTLVRLVAENIGS